MLKVECEACKAPYQVDERRVGPGGLKMRCPKCGHSFVVHNPNAAAAPPVAPPEPVVALPAAAKPMKSTMLGVGNAEASGSAAGAEDPFEGLPVAKPAAPKPPFGPKPVASAKPPPPVPPAKPMAPAPAQPPSAAGPPPLGAIDELDLPAIPDEAALPAIAKKPLAPARPQPPAAPLPPKPQVAPAAKFQPPSLADFEIELPSPDADLPARKPAAAPLPTKPGGLTFDIDLPSNIAGLPSAKAAPAKAPAPVAPPAKPPQASKTLLGSGAAGQADLPSLAAGLPSPSAGLPMAKGGFGEIDLPSLGGNLPALPSNEHDLPTAVNIGLPQVADNLPSAAGAGHNLPTFAGDAHNLPTVVGDQLPSLANQLPTAVNQLPALANQLPTVANQLPSVGVDYRLPTVAGNLPQAQGAFAPAFPSTSVEEADFGELELPRSGPGEGGGFEELELPRQQGAGAVPAPQKGESRATGGAGYGEVDLGSEATVAGDIKMDSVPPRSLSDADIAMPSGDARARLGGGGEAALEGAVASKRSAREVAAAPSKAPKIILAVIALLAIGGFLLAFTPAGIFGRFFISDIVNEGSYQRKAEEASAATRAKMAKDTFDQTRAAVDALAKLHTDEPRARALSAYAALAEYESQLRFGKDSGRAAMAKQWLAAVPKDTKYLGVALAAEDASNDDLAGARKKLDAASKVDVGDAVQQDIAFIRGEVELAAKDAPAAIAAFTKAAQMAPSARAHYGLARANALAGDVEKAKSEIGATLSASPLHAGALLLRASVSWEKAKNDTSALADLALVLEGKSKASASPADQSNAYALRGWIHFTRGRVGDARGDFDSALKLDARNVSALVGQGEVLFTEGRYTEALSRFDTAVQADGTYAPAIVSDAKAKIALDRLNDAKTQLTAARQAIPGDMRIAYWLGKAEESLGNKRAAEESYIAAIGLTDPTKAESIDPYVALSELLAGQGRATEAQAKLDEARQKLPDSSSMERALGEVAAVQGHFDEAVSHYQSAVEKDPQDLSSRFLLGVTYRRMQKIDLATTELDKVLAADKDYPGLAMERGILYEQSGHVDKALEQFRAALAKAPDDPDLKLRVGAAYVGIGDYKDAIPKLREVLDKRPNNADAHHYLGRALFLKGGSSATDAMRELKRAVELDTNRAEYHLYVAWIANETIPSDLGLASEEIQKALALDKLLAEGYWQKGVVERKQLAVDDAIRDLKHALQLKPTRFEAHAALAECYEDKNETNMAMVEWTKAIAGSEAHPDWRFRYGKLLLERGNAAAAWGHLDYATKEARDAEVRPAWRSAAEFAAAEASRRLGKKQDAIEHYLAYLDIATTNDPDRRDALSALSALGHPYEGIQ